MELKKREIINEREYAKKNEVSKSEVKNTIPKKWLVASSIGIVTLLYSNPNSIFGHIGVVFGCISYGNVNYTPLGQFLNTLSNFCGVISVACFVLCVVALCIYTIYAIKSRGITDKELKEKNEKNKKKAEKYMSILFILAVITYFFFAFWETFFSNFPIFIEHNNLLLKN